ncbi:hypothetical protein [Staphylococcus edaphicus]|uniref:Uncharacterized protein n=1 Tax=Staphylococcus edaphicus TaxID=1955013 RepID=A0A2C6WN35_9STAP|nr:hypothetical protein [Staphylococcus edaphicus]PHK50510.1 hypothetical protein BTJ66_03405 [Staphylococcus edaphicus]UQW81196.1 hypothetical protein MNY58_11525 [Staphylococcus edaphicus]
MISIYNEEVKAYLKFIDDQNPLHTYIVPGQMIVQMALENQRLYWTSFRVKYIESIEIGEQISFFMSDDDTLVVSNQNDILKIKIIKV